MHFAKGLLYFFRVLAQTGSVCRASATIHFPFPNTSSQELSAMRLPIFCASALFLAPALLAQHPTETEPNDTFPQANALAIGTQLEASMSTGTDVDWYTFSTTSRQRVRVHTNGLDTRITLIDANTGNLLGLDDDGRTSTNAFSSELYLNLDAGNYAVKVEPYSSTTSGNYSVEVGLMPARVFTGAESEPNDTVATANPITIPTGGALINASVGVPVVQLSDTVATATTTTISGAAALTAGAYTPAITGYGLYYVRMTSGVNVGLSRQISSNTATTITFTAFTTAPAAGDTYVIEKVDTDFYSITLTAPRVGLWFLITEGNAPFVCGHRYEVYDSAGVPLLASSTTAPAYGTNAANSSSLSARTSSIRVWPAGTYLIAVRSPASPFVAPYNQITTGNYCLELYADMKIGTGSTVAEVEPNNTIAQATPLTFGQRGTGNITINTGADIRDIWGPIVIPNRPVTVTFQSARGTPTPIADTTVNILSSTGTVSLAATTGNVLDWTSHGRTSLSFNGGGTYYVEVLSPGTAATQAGDYVIEVSEMMDAPYVSASYTLATANAACGVAPFPTLGLSWTSERPALGEVFSRNLIGCPANGVGFLCQGLVNTVANGSTPLPFDLTALGAPSCTVNVDPAVVTLFIANANGTALLDWNLPGDPAVRSLFVWEQAAVLNPAANTLGLQFSNYARIIAGERSF